jgi:hypothetical protein
MLAVARCTLPTLLEPSDMRTTPVPQTSQTSQDLGHRSSSRSRLICVL